jgi:hypothetical protein
VLDRRKSQPWATVLISGAESAMSWRQSPPEQVIGDVLSLSFQSPAAFLAQQPRLAELPGHVHLPCANPVAFVLVHAQRHQFQIGYHAVEFRADGTRNDVVHAQLVAFVRPPLHRRRSSFAHLGQTIGIETAELRGDVQIAQQCRLREVRRLLLDAERPVSPQYSGSCRDWE